VEAREISTICWLTGEPAASDLGVAQKEMIDLIVHLRHVFIPKIVSTTPEFVKVLRWHLYAN
jgi:hypothetical protein